MRLLMVGLSHQSAPVEVRERLAVDGIKANEVDWFKHELTTAEKKS